jgi:hypothetical protein
VYPKERKPEMKERKVRRTEEAEDKDKESKRKYGRNVEFLYAFVFLGAFGVYRLSGLKL